MSYVDLHDWDRCTRCGSCLAGCPVMLMDRTEARKEIAGLIAGDLSGRAIAECTLCYSCNRLCPVPGLEPYDLLQQRVLERRGDIPAHIRYFLNDGDEGTVWGDIHRRMSDSQRRILDSWAVPPPPSPEVLWVGCLTRSASPTDVANSRVLADLPKFGPYDLCCGEPQYRLGSWDAFMTVARRTYETLSRLRTDRLVCYCHACSYFLGNVYPKVFGKPLPFEIISMYEWLWDRLQAGELGLEHPLTYGAAVCESCNLTEMDPALASKLRDLYTAAGMQLREIEHRGIDNETCGFALMGKEQTLPASMKMVLSEQRKKYRDVRRSGTRTMALNCGGCRITFGFTSLIFGMRLRYMPEELLRAFGDRITEPMSGAFARFMRIFARRVPGFLLSSREAIGGPPGDVDSGVRP